MIPSISSWGCVRPLVWKTNFKITSFFNWKSIEEVIRLFFFLSIILGKAREGKGSWEETRGGEGRGGKSNKEKVRTHEYLSCTFVLLSGSRSLWSGISVGKWYTKAFLFILQTGCLRLRLFTHDYAWWFNLWSKPRLVKGALFQSINVINRRFCQGNRFLDIF